MLQAPVGQMEGRRRALRFGNVLVTLEDLLIVTWRRDPEEARRLLPSGLEAVVVDGAAYSSVLLFRNRALRPALLGFPRFSGPQINARTYVVDRTTGRPGAVYFHSLELAARALSAVSRHVFRVPFGYRRFDIESRREPDVALSARGTGLDLTARESPEAAPPSVELLDLWSNPHTGYFEAPLGRLKGWSIWHRAQRLRPMTLEKLELEPAARIGLRDAVPISANLVDTIDYEVYLPPRAV